MRVLCILGTRPEVIKLAPVVRALRRRGHEALVGSTGQHGEMLTRQLDDLGLALDVAAPDFPRMPSTTLNALLAAMLSAAAYLVASARPDVVLVEGDTTTALAGAIAGFNAGVPVGHVEAGLRSGDPRDPYPEEMNRRLIARLAALHFAPTRLAVENLQAEGIARWAVWTTGNTMVDQLRQMVPDPLAWRPVPSSGTPATLLVTCHRREAMDARLGTLVHAVRAVAEAHPTWQIRWPLHANPAITEAVKVLIGPQNVRLTEHLAYSAFVADLVRADLVITDSGGVIEEAATLGRRLLIVRDRTERPEAFDGGAPTRLVPMSEMAGLPQLAEWMLGRPEGGWSWAFGDGSAGERIVEALEAWWHPVGEPRGLRHGAVSGESTDRIAAPGRPAGPP
jgi:UDP-N-acetylglucosamine 2-epimerase (non-hydrolysing)